MKQFHIISQFLVKKIMNKKVPKTNQPIVQTNYQWEVINFVYVVQTEKKTRRQTQYWLLAEQSFNRNNIIFGLSSSNYSKFLIGGCVLPRPRHDTNISIIVWLVRGSGGQPFNWYLFLYYVQYSQFRASFLVNRLIPRYCAVFCWIWFLFRRYFEFESILVCIKLYFA